MKRKQKTTAVLTVLVAASLVGLVCLQAIFLKQAFELKTQAFRQNINAALASMVDKLETTEAVSKVFRVMMKTESGDDSLAVHQNVDVSLSERATPDSDFIFEGYSRPPGDFKIRDGKVYFTLQEPQHVRLRVLNLRGEEISELINEFKPAGEYELELDTTAADAEGRIYNFTSDGANHNMMIVSSKPGRLVARSFSGMNRTRIISSVLEELSAVGRLPIESRIQPTVLDSVVRTTLGENSINMPFAYGILAADEDSVRIASSPNSMDELRRSEFRSRLFPNDPFYTRNDLALYFPQQTFHLLKQTGVLFGSSLLLLALIIFSFVYTLRTIFKQERFANLLSEFINNMTHEFKTPISTISLASEALANPSVSKNREKLQRYGQIIQDENLRMRSQVEKILQMAVLERGEFELNISRVDVHETISKAIDNIELRIEKKKGQVIRNLRANPAIIEADGLHLANVIHNLLDNANKYCKTEPRIEIATYNDTEGVHIQFKDNGIGLAPEDRKHVFDKYYRVSTGNVHDVKGFGLGLSYVKLMVEAHGGTVDVHSEANKGSTFHIFIPYTYKNEKNEH